MTSAIISFCKNIGSICTIRRDEVILKGAFLVGTASLALLIGQYGYSTDTREEKYKPAQSNAPLETRGTPAYKEVP